MSYNGSATPQAPPYQHAATPIAPCQLVDHPGVPVDLPLLSMARVHIPTVVDVDRLPEWAGEVDDRQLGLHEGRWVAYDLGDTTTA